MPHILQLYICIYVCMCVFLFDIATSLCSACGMYACCGCKLARVQPVWVEVHAQVALLALCCIYHTHTHTCTVIYS